MRFCYRLTIHDWHVTSPDDIGYFRHTLWRISFVNVPSVGLAVFALLRTHPHSYPADGFTLQTQEAGLVRQSCKAYVYTPDSEY